MRSDAEIPPTRQLLLDQRELLADTIAVAEAAECAVGVQYARDHLARVDQWLSETDRVLAIHAGKFGRFGWAPTIDDICERLVFFSGGRERFRRVAEIVRGQVAA